MKRILIADDSESVAQALAACLTSGYDVTVTYRGDEALRHASTFPTCDLLVTDYLMPEMDGAELAFRFRSVHPAGKVLMLTGLGDDLHLEHDPADARLTKPFGPLELRAAVAALIGPPDRAQEPAGIPVPGPADVPLGGRLSDPMATPSTFPAPSRTALAQAELFAGAPAPLLASTVAGSETRDLQAGDRLLAVGDDNHLLYIVLAGSLSVHVPGTSRPHVSLGVGECVGELSLIDGLRASADVFAEEPTVVLALDREQLWTLMDGCPTVARNLLRILAGRVRHDDRVIGEADRLQRHYEEAATVDPLTGLRNRRWLDAAFERQAERTARVGRPLSLLMIDVDHFKTVNDECGHLVGDEVLRHLGQVLAGSLRPQDLLARFGGEEFVVLLPAVDAVQAKSVAERLRHAVEHAPSAPGGGVRPRVTVSVGVATREPAEGDVTTAALIERADRALYRAKQAGRNCVHP